MKLYKSILLFITTLLSCSLWSQDWIRTYTSTQGGGYGARWIIESYDKGYILLGDAGNYKYGLILKTDVNGFELWHKYFGNGSYHFVPVNIEQTLDSGYIVAGTMGKYGTNDAFILKLNACFEKEWCKVLYTQNYYPDYGRRIKPLPDGDYLLLTAYYEGITPGTRIHLHKFEPNGELIWQQAFARSDSLIFGEEGFDLSILNNNVYLITGDCYYPDSGQTVGKVRPLLIKSDSLSNLIWELPWTFNYTFWGKTYRSVFDYAGNYYSIGFRIGPTGQYPAMIKTNTNGNELYFTDLNDTVLFGQGQTITWTEDSLFFITAGWRNFDDSRQRVFQIVDLQGNVIQQRDGFLYSNAIVNTVKTFDNKFISIAIHMNNNYWEMHAYKLNYNLEYDTLYTTPFVYDSLCPYGITSDTTDLDCDILVLVDDEFVPLKDVKLHIYPNPATSNVTISFPDVTHTGKREISIYNSIGKEVRHIGLMRGDEETRIDISGLPRGIYFVAMKEKGNIIVSGKMMVAR